MLMRSIKLYKSEQVEKKVAVYKQIIESFVKIDDLQGAIDNQKAVLQLSYQMSDDKPILQLTPRVRSNSG